MNEGYKHYGFFFWAHLIVALIFIFSWILFSWWLVIIAVVLLQIQYHFLKGCILSIVQFSTDEACIPYYLHKWKFVKDKRKTKVFVRYGLPTIIIILALILQLVFNIGPLLF